MRGRLTQDRVGLGWRGELAAGIFANADQIDLLEVIADDYFRADQKKLDSLKYLTKQFQVTLHGVALGLASTHKVDSKRIEAMARLMEKTGIEAWSEHLAFVRALGNEIGHLAAPPRSEANIEGTIWNFEKASGLIGVKPQLENIATLYQPPGCKMTEPEWTKLILQSVDGALLFDLHNAYANALNQGLAPGDYIRAFPLERVRTVHLSGGHWIDEPKDFGGNGKRLLDDHVHDVPLEVFHLLEIVAEVAPQPLNVVIERDGNYPEMNVLLQQIQMAREALSRGRAKQNSERGIYERAAV